ncbi:MAG: glyoxalase superfamily protein [Pseudomonadota bacterium]
MDIPLPSRAALKAQAKRLRGALNAAGTPCSHAQALETLAHQWGARDWNTLHARAQDAPQSGYHPGQRVSGRYLGHRFRAVVKSVRLLPNGRHALTLRFDDAIDVVTSRHFSAWRRQVNCVVDRSGRSLRSTSDGQPHVVLHDHWARP